MAISYSYGFVIARFIQRFQRRDESNHQGWGHWFYRRIFSALHGATLHGNGLKLIRYMFYKVCSQEIRTILLPLHGVILYLYVIYLHFQLNSPGF